MHDSTGADAGATQQSGIDHDDDAAAQIDRALADAQRTERAELRADLTRQQQADEKIVDALSAPES